MAGLSFTPSPLTVARSALKVLWCELGRLAFGAGVFFLAPYLAAYFLVYKPALDGQYGDPTGYYARYYGFILLFFVVKAVHACINGQIAFNRLKGQPRPLHAVVPAGLVNAARTLAVYVPVAGLIYLGNAAWVAPGLIVGYVATFFLSAVLYDHFGLKDGWLQGLRVRRGHNLALAISYLLLSALTFAMQKSIAPLSGWVAQHLPADAATVTTAVVYGLIELVTTVGCVTLYVLPQESDAPRHDDLTAVFD